MVERGCGGVLWLGFWTITTILGCVGGALYVSNLDDSCLRCVCQGATGCNITAGCVRGYCGPFYLSRIYWEDGERVVLPEDDPGREGAFQDCAAEYSCAKLVVLNYMAKHGKDCNGDGVTDCEDYAMIHYNGGLRCDATLEGTAFHTRFTRCRPSPRPSEDELGDQPVDPQQSEAAVAEEG